MLENITVSHLKRSKVRASKCDLTEHTTDNSSQFRAQSCLSPISVSLLMYYGRRTHAQCNVPQPASPPDVLTEHVLVWKPGAWGFKMEVLLTPSSLTESWTSVFVTLKSGSICCLIFSSQFIFQLINLFPRNLSPLSILTCNSSMSFCWEAYIFQSSQALISSCLAWATSILLIFSCPADSRLVLGLRKRWWNQDN